MRQLDDIDNLNFHHSEAVNSVPFSTPLFWMDIAESQIDIYKFLAIPKFRLLEIYRHRTGFKRLRIESDVRYLPMMEGDWIDGRPVTPVYTSTYWTRARLYLISQAEFYDGEYIHQFFN